MRRKKVLAVLVVLAAAAFVLPAQDRKNDDPNTRMVQGIVTDAGGKPVQGAVVQLKDMRSLQVRSFITQDGGAFHFSGLKADADYQVKADYNGASSAMRTLSVFDNRRTPVVNLKLEKK